MGDSERTLAIGGDDGHFVLISTLDRPMTLVCLLGYVRDSKARKKPLVGDILEWEDEGAGGAVYPGPELCLDVELKTKADRLVAGGRKIRKGDWVE